jgi:hypothetical protein
MIDALADGNAINLAEFRSGYRPRLEGVFLQYLLSLLRRVVDMFLD